MGNMMMMMMHASIRVMPGTLNVRHAARDIIASNNPTRQAEGCPNTVVIVRASRNNTTPLISSKGACWQNPRLLAH
jgi:hypothetical protein